MTDEEKLGQEYLERAFAKMHELYLEENPPMEGEIVYSLEYIKAINTLLGKRAGTGERFRAHLGKRMIAAIVAALLLIGSAVCAYAFREPIAEFITEIKDKFVEIFFCEAAIASSPGDIDTVYTLGYVPDGYVLESRESWEVKARTVWSNGEDRIIFMQRLLSNNITFDNEESCIRMLYIDELQIVVTEKSGVQVLYWNDGKYTFKLTFTKNVSDEECIKIIKSAIE